MATETDPALEIGDIQNPVIIDWQQGNALGACMGELFERTLWTDVSFKCKDQETEGPIKAHKIVLAARSPVFQAMFFGPCTDGNDEVDMPDASSETFRLFIRYLYSDAVKLTEDTVFEVLELAHLYQVYILVQYCSVYLSSVISSSNACRIFACALLYNLDELKADCCSFIDNHAEEVLGSDGFMNISADCLLYLLKGHTLYAPETSILNAAENWSKRRLVENNLEETGTNVRQCLGESFYHLRLPTLSYKSLLENISRKGYLRVEEYADIAAFINKVPGIKNLTNSCVERLPLVENVTLLEQNTDAKYKTCNNGINISLQIWTKKSVEMSSITFSEMKPDIQTKPYSSVLDYPNSFDLNCYISINNQANKYNGRLRQPPFEAKTLTLNPPFVLKRTQSPHTLNVVITSECEKSIILKVRGKIKGTSKSITGNIQVEDISGRIGVVESMEFVNASSRSSTARKHLPLRTTKVEPGAQ